MRGDLLEEVTHLQGWTYWISGNAPAYPPEYHFFGGYALPAQGSWFKLTPRNSPDEERSFQTVVSSPHSLRS